MVSIKELIADSSSASMKTTTPPFKTNIYNLKELTKFFGDALQTDAGFETRRMVIIWAHGAGLGYVGNIDMDSPVPNYLQGIAPVREGRVAHSSKIERYNDEMRHLIFLKSHLSIKGDPLKMMDEIFHTDKVRLKPSDTDLLGERLQIITAVQMNTMFRNALPKDKKIDVLIANTCYTQVLETGYALKDSMSVLISPQTTIPFTGFNYNSLFRLMERQPGLPVKDLAANVRANFTRKYAEPRFRKNFRIVSPAAFDLLGEVSFSANDLSHYKDLVDGFFAKMADRFLAAVKDDNEKLLDIIDAARAKCLDISPSAPFNVSNYGIIDLTHFFRTFVRLCRKKGNHDFDDMPEQLTDLTRKIRIAWHKAAGAGEYSERVASRSPHFLSFFFPSSDVDSNMTNLLIKVYLDKFGRQTLPRDFSSWPEFIIKRTQE